MILMVKGMWLSDMSVQGDEVGVMRSAGRPQLLVHHHLINITHYSFNCAGSVGACSEEGVLVLFSSLLGTIIISACNIGACLEKGALLLASTAIILSPV